MVSKTDSRLLTNNAHSAYIQVIYQYIASNNKAN